MVGNATLDSLWKIKNEKLKCWNRNKTISSLNEVYKVNAKLRLVIKKEKKI